ncbi:helix-turn-helix domain-containing protein [Ensifer sp. ENS06]|uniref:helix-turn-helix domain-containing protein n=1 Tax=Ensifer sp. ENS06 TaxID=2769276 RepID=UPI00177D926B|nr:helix-turn-helix domain-containing protein [Ensifer sp. ENS06]MBD9628151.1 helix-turn-helix domain-containing protein [Ensifer sp. ENS06]
MARCPSPLNLVDRRRLYHIVERKVPIKEMSRQLGRYRSTIDREIRPSEFDHRESPE